MRPAILSGAMAIPLEHVRDRATVKKALTAKHQPMGADEATMVYGYREDGDYLYVPRQYGLNYCDRKGIPWEDQTSSGFAVEFPKMNSPRDYQVQPLAEIAHAFTEYYDIVFKAHTGWGKTYGGLWLFNHFSTTTIILVDQENLMGQWLESLEKHCGMTVENGHVGIAQGQKWDYEGKSVVIAMVQTLSQKLYPKEFYDYFGLVLFDEVHTVGAPTFSVVLLDFPAMYRMGVSATPKRKDALQKLLEYSLGKVRVAADKEHDESAVYIREHDTVYSWYANTSPKIGRIITEVAEDGSRNLLLAETTLSLYETGRDTLVLSDRIEQLKHLTSLLYYMGAPADQLGLYAGYEPIYRYAKNPNPQREPLGLVEYDDPDDEEHHGLPCYTPVSLQLISKRIPRKRLAQIKTDAGLLHATYGMCAKGFDEPRLKAGVDATPRGEVEQIHGRILRDVPDAKKPIWATIRDTSSYRLMFSFVNRIRGYLKSNGRMYYWPEDGELTECPETEVIAEARERHQTLQSLRIQTHKDGSSTLVTQSSVSRQKAQHVKDTVKAIRSRRLG